LRWGHPAEERDDATTEEALFLAELVATALPEAPEALGLMALLGFCEARKAARTDDAGDFVPLDRKDTSRWNRASLVKADAALARAARIAWPAPVRSRDPGRASRPPRVGPHASTCWLVRAGPSRPAMHTDRRSA